MFKTKKILISSIAAFLICSNVASAQLFRGQYRSYCPTCQNGSCQLTSNSACANGRCSLVNKIKTKNEFKDTEHIKYKKCSCGEHLKFNLLKGSRFYCPFCHKQTFVCVEGRIESEIVPLYEDKQRAVYNNATGLLLEAVNSARNANGASSLAMNPNGIAGAQQHSNNMLSHGICYHDRNAFGGYNIGGAGGEIVASWQRNEQQAVHSWLNSPAHRNIMLNRSYRSASTGVAYDSSGRGYFTVRFWV